MTPKGWNQIKVKDFIQIDKIINSEYENDTDKLIDIAAYFCNGLDNVKLNELHALDFMFHPELMAGKIPLKFIFNKKLYRLNLNMAKLTAGQYIDLTTFTKNPEEINSNIHRIMAVISLPCNWLGKRRKYDGERMLLQASEFLELPITLVYPITVFFCANWENLMRATDDYFSNQKEATMTKLRENLLKQHGAGSLTLTK